MTKSDKVIVCVVSFMVVCFLYSLGYSHGKERGKGSLIDSVFSINTELEHYKDSLEMAKDELFYFTGDRNYNCD